MDIVFGSDRTKVIISGYGVAEYGTVDIQKLHIYTDDTKTEKICVLSRDQVFEHNNRAIRVGHILKKNPNSESLWQIRSYKRTISLDCMMPLLYTEDFPNRFTLGAEQILVNIYSQTNIEFIPKADLYLLYRADMSSDFAYTFFTGLRRTVKANHIESHPNFVALTKVDHFHDIVSINVNDVEIYKLLKEGLYSKLPSVYKHKLIQSLGNQDSKNIWQMRFDKDEKLRNHLSNVLSITLPEDSELCSPANEMYTANLMMKNPKKPENEPISPELFEPRAPYKDDSKIDEGPTYNPIGN